MYYTAALYVVLFKKIRRGLNFKRSLNLYFSILTKATPLAKPKATLYGFTRRDSPRVSVCRWVRVGRAGRPWGRRSKGYFI